MIELWIALTGVLVAGGVIVLLAWRHDRSIEAGAPAPEIDLDDTTPIEGPITEAALTLAICPHDVPLSKHCELCEGVFRGKHVTLDDDTPKGAA